MNEWHVDPETWQAYATGRLDPAADAAVETHVVRCAHCRETARAADPMTAGHMPLWEAVRTEITASRPPAHLRWLRRLGVRDDTLVVLASAGDLRLPWSLAVGGALLCAALAAHVAHAQLAYLLLAPLVPLLAVATAFDATDPLRDLTAPTPYSKLRLALLRTTAALAVGLPSTALVGAVIPALHPLAWVWLLPSLCLSSAALILLTRIPARQACLVVGGAWALGVVVVDQAGRLDAVAGAAAQAGFAVAALLLGAALARAATTLPAMGATR